MSLLFYSTVDSAARWRAQLERLSRELDIRVWPEIGDPAEIDYALVWRPAPGLLATLPNLKLILSLGAGVDHILIDPHLPPGVPIVRLVDPYMTDAMSEFVILQVLRLHRQDLDYLAQQRAHVWQEREQVNAADVGEREWNSLEDPDGQISGRHRQQLTLCRELAACRASDRGRDVLNLGQASLQDIYAQTGGEMAESTEVTALTKGGIATSDAGTELRRHVLEKINCFLTRVL